ncbi:2'-O-glycosyltransferase CruG [Gloeothece verrucosa]|uniref:Glycosyl transferase family 2 n=1 Tax=Gloeothece verrucosa (strain PCC 7822) TaxID=497965 RepID=E0UAT0_GLOV7|nr:glycosyltransferase family 2 protein [Gloeothece verrucosa]ADN13932.1 glycosyl transferase family 2 [Gloeothece verrucosa PCC 7822]
MLIEAILAVSALVLLLFQGTATLILLARLLKGPFRRPPLEAKQPHPDLLGSVSVVVPTLNEVERIAPCLEGLSQQSYEVREILVVDSHSTDGTPERVQAVAHFDPRFRLLNDGPLPSGWVGRPWALHTGFLQSSPKSRWILGIDADTQPQPGLIASIVKVAEEEGYDIVSLSPQFILKYPGEWWLQPALLMTLLYRFDSAGARESNPNTVMANGQCFLSRREVLEQLGGYESAASSFCDDVTLARYAATQGYKVGFLDGAKVIRVRMYNGFEDTWSGWGRSLDLKDASTQEQLWGDLGLLICTQGLPLLLSVVGSICLGLGYSFPSLKLALGLNLFLVLIRFALLWAIYPSYYRCSASGPASWLFWLSPLADPLAVIRIALSASQRPTQWRGRIYS